MNKKIIPEILNRKSSVCFSSESISLEEIDLLIEATKWAPSSRNMQPWKVIFVSKKHDNYKNVLNSLSDSNQIWAKNAEIFAIFSIFDDKNLKRKLSIREINEKNLSFSLKADDFKKNNIELIENTPEEILSAVKELYEKLKNNNELDSKNKDLQKNFWKAFPYKKNIHGRIVTLVGNDFLNQNKYLLNDI